jgi:hypothetical protein
VYGSGQGRQGIARHVPSCPRALLRSTLTALTSAMTRRLGIASNKSTLQKRL